MTAGPPRRTIADLALVVAAAALQWCAGAALRVLPFGRIRDAVETTTRGHLVRPATDEAARVRVAWVVGTASAVFVPFASCLTEAIAAVMIARWLGYDATLQFGVKSPSSPALLAHAWATSGDRVLVGGGTGEWTSLRAARQG